MMALPIQTLLVEDSPGDADLTCEALECAKVSSVVHHVRDGVEAMKYLHNASRTPGFTRPDLILLDWSLPRKSGLDVLVEIKRDPRLRSIPVVVLSSSSAEGDVLAAYREQAACFVTKPVDLSEFMTVVSTVANFWFDTVRLP